MEDQKEKLSDKIEEDIQYAKAEKVILEQEFSEIKELLKKNIEISNEILESTQKTRRYIKIRMIMGIVWILVILAPIILAIIWLPPYIKEFMENYGSFLTNSERIIDLFK